MSMIRVKPSKPERRTFLRVGEFLYGACSYIGDSIIKYPNKLFYILLMVMGILCPFFGIFILLCLLCSVYRRGHHERIY